MRKGQWIIFLLVVFGLLGAWEVSAATYYVKPDGNDNADGRSDATAWKTIAKVNSFKFQPGDDVYFKCGGVWTDTYLYIDWNGLDDNNSAVVGAYYMNNGVETIGVSGQKPIINGQDAIPSDKNLGLISAATNRQYVTVENFRLINSEGQGVVFQDGASNITVRNIETYNTYNAAIKFSRASNGIIEGCHLTNSGRMQVEGAPDRPAIIAVNVESHDFIIRKNYVHDNYGEGIGLYKAVYNCIVEDNVAVNNVGFNIYIDAGQGITVRRNMVYNTRSDRGAGIGFSDEGRVMKFPPGIEPCNQNTVYDNFVAYVERGIVLSGGRAGSTTKNCTVYNNTVVACRSIGIDFPIGPYVDNAVKNNVVWCGTPGDTEVCKVGRSVDHNSGIIFGHNYYSSAPDANMQSPTDPGFPNYANGAPKIMKTTGWQSLTGGLNYSDFAPVDGSLLIDNGEDLGDPWHQILDPERSVFAYANPIDSVIVVKDQRGEGSGWEIGAALYGSSAKNIPLLPPKNVRLVND